MGISIARLTLSKNLEDDYDIMEEAKKRGNGVRDGYGEHIPGWMSSGELRWLYSLGKRYNSIIEIGSWQGRSTFALCRGAEDGGNGCKIYAVDHFGGSSEHQDQIKTENLDVYGKFQENVGHFSCLEIIKMASKDAIRHPKVPRLVDVVFIDGAHEEEFVFYDLTLWVPRAKYLVCGHDYGYQSVQNALKKYFGEIHGCEVVVDTIWMKSVEYNQEENGEEIV